MLHADGSITESCFPGDGHHHYDEAENVHDHDPDCGCGHHARLQGFETAEKKRDA